MGRKRMFEGDNLFVRLPKDAREKLREIAKKRWTTTSDIIREAVREYLERTK